MNLTPSEKKIIADLHVNGDNVAGNISDNIDVTPNYVSSLLSDLEAKGFTRSKGRGVYTLTTTGAVAARNFIRSYEMRD